MENKILMQHNSLSDALRHLHCLQRKRGKEEFEKIGLTEGQPKVLGYLNRHDGCIQRELAENCHVKASTVTSLLANMERDGLIYRVTNPNNRRILNVFLTEKGKEADLKIQEVFQEVDAECFFGFSEKEKEETMQYLSRLAANLESRKDGKKVDTTD